MASPARPFGAARLPRLPRQRLQLRGCHPPAGAGRGGAHWPERQPRRLDLQGMEPAQRREVIQETLSCLDCPTLVTGALPDLDEELWLGQLVEKVGPRLTEFQVREDGETTLYTAPLQECLRECATASDHDSAVLVFDEGILSDCPEALSRQLVLPEDEWGPNWFFMFPPRLQPEDCILIGGSGARSTLHADPFSWQGYNYLLQGTKLWTFFPPAGGDAEGLEPYRLEPNAWGEGADKFGIAAGWQSPVDLYYHLHLSDEGDLDSWELSDLWEEGLVGFSPSHSSINAAFAGQSMTFLQREGELLLIPPECWHQTYHMSATLAVASQLLNPYVADSVYDHILDWTGGKRPNLTGLEPDQQITAVLTAACKARYGADGDRMLEQIWAS